MARSAKPWTDTPLRRAIFAKTTGRCFYCWLPLKCSAEDTMPRDWLLLKNIDRLMVPDHAQPKSRGGTDDEENLVPSCRGCNAAKGSLTSEEYRFVKAFRARDPALQLPSDTDSRIERDWLCIYSDDQERQLFVANFPWAAVAYSRRGAAR
jgi:5-methylcytosine-specific restriction endonuclease McrA